MNHHKKIVLSALALMLFFVNANCQTKMPEGKIEYSITNIFSNRKQPIDTFNKYTNVFLFKDKKQRTDEFLNGFISRKSYYDGNDPTTLTMVNSNNKVYEEVEYTYKDFDPAKVCPKKNFIHLKEEKTISGYKCRKATYSLQGDTTILYVYYSKEVTAPLAFDLIYTFSNLDGYPMEYDINYSDKKVIYTVTKIKMEKVDDIVFVIPKTNKSSNKDDKHK